MTGFRVKSPIFKVFGEMGKISASQFSPEVHRFLGKALNTAISNTPVRDLKTINANQRKQYRRRLNYIPSYFDTSSPTLIFNEENEQWMRMNGNWYRPDIWELPSDVRAMYELLLAERMRRDQKPEQEFLRERSQARFLYKRSWWEIGQSAGVNVRATQSVVNAVSRHNPPKKPRRGYVQKRGGKNVFSIVIYNPFLEEQSRYKFFTGKQLIESAMDVHREVYRRELSAKQQKLILDILLRLLA